MKLDSQRQSYQAGYEAGLHALEESKSSKVAPKPAVKATASGSSPATATTFRSSCAWQPNQRATGTAAVSAAAVSDQSCAGNLLDRVGGLQCTQNFTKAASTSKASLVSNNGMPQRLSASRPQASTRGLTRNNLALLDLKSKATSKANNRMRDGTRIGEEEPNVLQRELSCQLATTAWNSATFDDTPLRKCRGTRCATAIAPQIGMARRHRLRVQFQTPQMFFRSPRLQRRHRTLDGRRGSRTRAMLAAGQVVRAPTQSKWGNKENHR